MRGFVLLLVVSAMATMAFTNSASATVVTAGADGLYIVEPTSSTMIFEGATEGMGVSPDGEEVVFTPTEGEHEKDLMLYDVGTEDTSVISSHSEEGIRWSQPRFEPNGTSIVAKADEGIYSIDTDGTHLRRLIGGQPFAS